MPINFFYEHLGRWVLRNDTPYQIPDFKTPDANRKVVSYLQDLQEAGFRFSPLAKPEIHISDSVCTSCQG